VSMDQFLSGPQDSPEWAGEPHVLVVRALRLPDGPLEYGEFTDYSIEHPPTCKQEKTCLGTVWTCDVSAQESEGLEFSLSYSGTPITAPGTYRIQGWGRKLTPEPGICEYDSGVSVIAPEED
jgi:hypothetical protein